MLKGLYMNSYKQEKHKYNVSLNENVFIVRTYFGFIYTNNDTNSFVIQYKIK